MLNAGCTRLILLLPKKFPERIGLKPETFEGKIKIRLFIASILGLLLSSAVNCQLSTVNCQLSTE
ncbi:hypothetical protein C7B69_01765 [filamentous cyanobacterium Phorm 46]|nr:hypothetical protein C7B69_01765 [filamentous cyanobacterium Phorm 46]PSB50845.1 hypothetical protein C7B67_13030 [filamentous cyanobacterium Phorm 6]